MQMVSVSPEAELLKGELFPKAMGSKPHSRLQKRLIVLIDPFEQKWLALIAPEQSLRLSPETVLIPDVCVLQPDDATENMVTDPPLLCIEILPPSDRFSFTINKCRAYLEWGVPVCWILDPDARGAWTSSIDGLHEAGEDSLLEAGPIALAMSDVFAA